MKLPRWLSMRRGTSAAVVEARKNRTHAEAQLAEEEERIVRPLRQMRKENHITERVVREIRQGGAQ